MEHETGRAVLPGVAKALGAVALICFGTGYWYVAIPCVVGVVLCILQLRRWTHRELEERARLAESPTEEDQAVALAWDEDGGVAVDRRREEPGPDDAGPDERR
ncbi:hypothetical protein [Clavibacter michiganensis]|uniref:Uncharacterized protein n=1 Tax=Clavibacter michiganensis TaxID=28447 RepID=A0A251YSQ3_9MICO|nr:hypothetical protein [Clavibacter michiganensis]OUE27270.1 hypothetical protein BFL37_04065 [Clavibacter michiganensis]